jgi:hypothetical protein
MPNPPRGLPSYRVLTGVDDATFCRRVSAALELGYDLYGSPAATFDGHNVIVAQALIWPGQIAARARTSPSRKPAARRRPGAGNGNR